jgi:DNA-binding MarR family transcriptional regulator
MSTRLDDIALDLHDGLITFQRKRRLIARMRGAGMDSAGPRLSYVEESVLQLTRDGDGMSIGQLAECVGIERSWMSRVVSGLDEQKLVTIKPDPSDKRSKVVVASSSAGEVLREVNEFAREVMDEALTDLTKSERSQLTKHIEALCSGMGAAPTQPDSSADPLDVQFARLSRASGVYGSGVLGSNLNITQVQVLHLLADHSGQQVTIRDLDVLLPFDTSTVSRTVAAFEAEGLVDKVQSKSDRRSYYVNVSRKGREALTAYRKTAQKTLATALSKCPRETGPEAVELLAKATHRMPRALGYRDESDIVIRPLPSAPKNKIKPPGDEAIVHHFTAQREGAPLADIRVVRRASSNVPVEISVTGNFVSREDLGEVLNAIMLQIH